MRDLLILAIHLLVNVAKLRPRGVLAIAAESLVLKHQLLNVESRLRIDGVVAVDAEPYRLASLLGAL